MSVKEFEATIEQATGQSIEYARKTPLDELRSNAERARGGPLKFVTFFPWIGRGNVLRDRMISHEQAEAAYDDAIGRLRTE
jgi:hypothetical protein